jgi:hypothetical protein
MTYVYGCPKDKTHPRREVQHAMGANPTVKCERCRATMRRIPQPFRFGILGKADRMVVNWLDHNFERKRRGLPLVNKYKCTEPHPEDQTPACWLDTPKRSK